MNTIIDRCAVDINLLAAINLARNVYLLPSSVINGDEGVVLSSVLAAAFGGHAGLRPWAVTRREGTKVTIVGNGWLEDLQAALDLAAPEVQSAILSLRSVQAIEIKDGKIYRLQTRACPVQRITNEGGRRREGDVLRIQVARKEDDSWIDRAELYPQWLATKLLGTEMQSGRMDGFSLTKMFRSTHERKWKPLLYPDTRLSAMVKVTDAEKFAAVVRTGVGRQRVYGFGWLWLQEVA